jgi:hypothetical protein
MTTSVDRLDGLSSSTAIKAACRVATTASILLQGEQTIDGVDVVSGDRVLVKNQTLATENGIWICDTGYWGRARDFDTSRDYALGTRIMVREGTVGRAEYEVTDLDPLTISVGVSPASTYANAQAAVAAAATASAAAAAAATAIEGIEDVSDSVAAAAASAAAAAASETAAATSAGNAAVSATSAEYWANQAQAIAGGSTSATSVTFTPVGAISAVNVQAALAELDSEKQPVDSDLTAIAALSSTGILVRSGTGAANTRSVAVGDGLAVTNGSGVAGNPTIAFDFTNPASDTTLAGTEQVIMSDGGTIKRTTTAAIAALAAVGSGGRVQIGSDTSVSSGASEVDITLPTTGYTSFEIELHGVTHSSTTNLNLRLRVSGDASVRSGGSDYSWFALGSIGTVSANGAQNSNAISLFASTMSSSATNSGIIRLFHGGSAAFLEAVIHTGSSRQACSCRTYFAGPYDLFRIYPSSGTLSAGTIRLFGFVS